MWSTQLELTLVRWRHQRSKAAKLGIFFLLCNARHCLIASLSRIDTLMLQGPIFLQDGADQFLHLRRRRELDQPARILLT